MAPGLQVCSERCTLQVSAHAERGHLHHHQDQALPYSGAGTANGNHMCFRRAVQKDVSRGFALIANSFKLPGYSQDQHMLELLVYLKVLKSSDFCKSGGMCHAGVAGEAHQEAVSANGLGLPDFEDEDDSDELLSDEDAPDLQDEIAKTLTSLKVHSHHHGHI